MKASGFSSTKSPRRKVRGPATCAHKSKLAKLILFDIDGTLVLTGGAGVRAMTLAFQDIFRVSEAFREIPMPGRTDPLIVAEALARYGLSSDARLEARFRGRYRRHLSNEIHREGPRKGVMPGVRELLDTLSGRADVFLALLTGNYADAARIKLEYFDLWRYFVCGAYGEDAPDRSQLVPLAIDRARACGAPPISPREVLVVGDTTLDVACARAAGVRPIAVATGGVDSITLRESGAEVVFENLADADAFLRLLDGGEPEARPGPG